MATKNEALKSLEQRELAGVAFIRDYLQLSFDAPSLTALVWPSVTISGEVFEFGTPGYRDVLCQQIGKKVVSAEELHEQDLLIRLVRGICG